MNYIKQELLTVCISTSCHAQMFFFSFSATRGSSGTADSEQRRVRTKLRRFLQRRPTLQSVKEKGYIRGELSGQVRLSDAHTESCSQTQDAMFLYPSPVQITCSAVTWTHCVTEKTTPSLSLLRSASERWRGEVNTTHTLIHTTMNSRLTAECVFRSGRGRDLQSEWKPGRDPETTTQS